MVFCDIQTGFTILGNKYQGNWEYGEDINRKCERSSEYLAGVPVGYISLLNAVSKGLKGDCFEEEKAAKKYLKKDRGIKMRIQTQ